MQRSLHEDFAGEMERTYWLFICPAYALSKLGTATSWPQQFSCWRRRSRTGLWQEEPALDTASQAMLDAMQNIVH